MFADLAPEIVLLLAAAALLAGFVDAIAGGGGLIVVPAMLLAGLSPVQALGTNKLQGLFATAAAALAYAGRGHVDLKTQLSSVGLAFLGGAGGAALATVLPGEWLRTALPPVLITIALYFAFKPNMDDVDRARRMAPFLFGLTVVPLIGLYDGLIGAGGGSFYMLAFVVLAGHGLLKATAHTKLLNFFSSLGAFGFFAAADVVSWQIGLTMGVCQLVGARMGAALAMSRGARLIKPLLVVISMALALRLLAA